MGQESKSTVNRQTRILDILEINGQIFINELSRQFNVSQVTIRNDLAHLEKKNQLIRARGGAIKIKFGPVGLDASISDKVKDNFIQKQLIGKAAIKFIKEDDSVILDSGTTVLEVAKNMGSLKNVTVVTNAINIAHYLSENTTFNIFMPGGHLRHNSLSLVGVLAEDTFKEFYCDILFLGADGFDTTQGLSTPNVEEAHLNQVMIEHAKKVIVTCDSSKFFRRRFAFIAPLNKIDIIITDSSISPEDQKRIENAGVHLVIAE